VAKKKDVRKQDQQNTSAQEEIQETRQGDPPPAPPAEAQGEHEECKETTAFPIVGIGASAGGLEAFEKFFSAMPPDSGMAFVLVQHLSSPHKSILNGLVQRLTRMKVYQVTDGVEVKPNCAYIIPPNKDMALLHGHLHLMEPGAPRGLRLPIDFFFRSLAQDQHERAICIVLSGTGSDGTLGLKAIKGEGGMAMTQDATSARYDGMPCSAIATGLVDYILPPQDMPQQLMTYVEHAFGPGAKRVVVPVPAATDSLQKIFILLRAQVGHDFSYYKQNTIRRRIERRMAVNQITKLDSYVRYLQQNPLEVETLFRELLIGVTSFFRDSEAFAILEESVIPRLFEERTLDQPVRVWVPGCSTGEEAYSIAMLVQEHIDTLKQAFKVQIFATDIDGDAIEKARVGVYPGGIVADVSPERLGRFFSRDDNTYQVKKTIRDMVVFAEQNVIEDPPFSKMDLISCRNLLIYMGPELQKRVLPLFHYSLRQEGVLFLGNSESVGKFVDLFSTLDRKWKLYQRKGAATVYRPALDFHAPPFMNDVAATRADVAATERRLGVRELAERALLQHYTPACAIVNERGEVLYIHGRSGKYLEPASGEASLNILKMAREGLRMELTSAMRKVIAQHIPVRYPGLRVKTNGERQIINLTVRPVMEPPSMRGLIMVLFEDVIPERRVEDVKATGEPITDKDQRIAVLERELQAKGEYLQITIEELETSNEELKSTNEELQSSNEELQSTNEELETSKEELQSVNEELVTVNAELQEKIDELSQTNNDMSNLLAGTGVGTVFVDHQLCIQRFTPAATNVINLIQTDVGRPVGHIVSNLVSYDHLVQDVREVLDTLVPKEAEVQTQDGLWYLMRILPYRTLENVIEGAVLTFVEVTELKQAETELRRLATVVHDSNDAITVQDFEGRIIAWNPGAERMYGWSEAEALAMNVRDIVPEDRREEALDIVKRLAQREVVEPFETQRITKGGEILHVQLTATVLVDAARKAYAIATTERDVIRRKA
jgi:two-component system CheB/CheR fusion protein